MDPLTIHSLGSQLYIQAVSLHKSSQFDRAFELFQRASQENHLRSKVFLGICYHEGKGVPKNHSKAFKWWQSAEEHPYALFYIGRCYETGCAVQMDTLKAIEYYKRAALKGCVIAYRELGYCYRHGRGVLRDQALSQEQFEAAANRGDSVSLYKLGKAAKTKRLRISTKYFALAANMGHAKACLEYAEALNSGAYCKMDVALSERYIDFAAESGDEKAILKRKRLWKNKQSICIEELTKYWLHCLKRNPNHESFIPLGLSYFYGYGCEKNYREAKSYLDRALLSKKNDSLDPEFYVLLGKSWLLGDPLVQNNKFGIACLKLAIQRESLNAFFCLFKFFYNKNLLDDCAELLRLSYLRKCPDLCPLLDEYEKIKNVDIFKDVVECAYLTMSDFYWFDSEEKAMQEILKAESYLKSEILPNRNQSVKILFNLGRDALYDQPLF